MGKVHDRRRSAIDHLQTPSKLTPKGILGRVQAGRKIAFRHVLHQCVICMAALEQGLPYMMVCVNKTRRDDLVCAIDDFGARRSSYVRRNHRNLGAGDEDVCPTCLHAIVLPMDESGSILEQ